MKILFLIAQDGFRDEEYFEPKKVFESEGIDVITASIKAGMCKGKLGEETNADIAIKDADINDYDALVIAGGPGALELGRHEKVLKLIRKFFSENIAVGSICISPIILAKAGVLSGRRVTLWNGDGKQSGVVENAGAIYTGDDVTVDDRLVTANGPAAAVAFGREIVKLLKGE